MKHLVKTSSGEIRWTENLFNHKPLKMNNGNILFANMEGLSLNYENNITWRHQSISAVNYFHFSYENYDPSRKIEWGISAVITVQGDSVEFPGPYRSMGDKREGYVVAPKKDIDIAMESFSNSGYSVNPYNRPGAATGLYKNRNKFMILPEVPKKWVSDINNFRIKTDIIFQKDDIIRSIKCINLLTGEECILK